PPAWHRHHTAAGAKRRKNDMTLRMSHYDAAASYKVTAAEARSDARKREAE
ncbi:hypothetical protein U1Q18_050351, partial [Sarracenia purpurea var. burkii]